MDNEKPDPKILMFVCNAHVVLSWLAGLALVVLGLASLIAAEHNAWWLASFVLCMWGVLRVGEYFRLAVEARKDFREGNF